ncbi:hypothetical protein IQ260_06365 [Leptolyngbya cf. ectocarpi LEGE 11479]|uniref:Uncharacterized protein n=1 Tax=Leptolyngbya cf. ectocarpi LEGE 11479 TaxID=1828722 RepID=A0A928X0M4_LEPEC|nr:hypothetical protein [Leptolyngbya ectocarpi]MBE9066272.1 hypothetical protein [Leptolyngbya cf. ectocarpi LEGE 11479]
MGYRWLGGAIIVLLSSGWAGQGMAQSYPDCPPPASGEYLLLVRGADESERDRTLSILPVDKPTLVCNYLGDTVVRAGGFDSLEVANSWALYMSDIEQLETVVVESTAYSPEPTAPDEPVAESAPMLYQPTLLGEGVAVLVDYQQDPAIGRNLAQQGNVGLAVYLQQPYLLVLHTTDTSAAAARLQQLVDSGLTSFLVDSQQVIRLTDTIR